MIYQISNPANDTVNYVCPNQEVIDEGIAREFQGVFSVGNQTNALDIAQENKLAWLNKNLDLFAVTKDIDPDPVQTTWVVCDLNTELENTNIDYNIFNVINGYYTTATGLANAKLAIEQVKQETMNYFVVMNEFEVWPDIKNPGTIGVQEL